MKRKKPKRTLKARREEQTKKVLPEVEQYLRDYVKKRRYLYVVTAKEISKYTGISLRDVKVCLMKLNQRGLVSQPGPLYCIRIDRPLNGEAFYAQEGPSVFHYYGGFRIIVQRTGHRSASRYEFTYERGIVKHSWEQKLCRINKTSVLRAFKKKKNFLLMCAFETEE